MSQTLRHDWRDFEQLEKGKTLWVGRSRFPRQLGEAAPPVGGLPLPIPSDAFVALAMEDESRPAGEHLGGERGGTTSGVDCAGAAIPTHRGDEGTQERRVQPDDRHHQDDPRPAEGEVHGEPIANPTKANEGLLMRLLRGATPASDEEVVNFGRYKGYTYKELPQSYTDWVLRELAVADQPQPEFQRLANWINAKKNMPKGGGGKGSKGYRDPESLATTQPPPPELPPRSTVKDVAQHPSGKMSRREMDSRKKRMTDSTDSDFSMVDPASASATEQQDKKIADLEKTVLELKAQLNAEKPKPIGPK